MPQFLESFLQGMAWVVFPIASFVLFRILSSRYAAIKKLLGVGIEWELLEIKIPKDILKTPKAMEQIFSSVHAIEKWASFDLVGRAGESHFYIRIGKEFRHLVESAIYAQYPEAEIMSIPPENDYLARVPEALPNDTYDVYGVELMLKKANAYPIRTYPAFEESVEERRIDPISGIIEAISKLKNDEHMWIQILIEPADDAWKKEADVLIDSMTGKRSSAPKPSLRPSFNLGLTLGDVILAPFIHPSSPITKFEAEKSEKTPAPTSGQREVAKAMEEKVAKIGFKTTIRFVYIDRKDSFTRSNIVAVIGAFRQFNTQNMNSLEIDPLTVTAGVRGFFKDAKLLVRKRKIYDRYRALTMRQKSFILNTEELATIYHFPMLGVKPPSLSRIESKRSGAPPNLPTL